MPPTLVPQGINDAISWFENHLDDWNANQPNLGVTPQQAADISKDTAAARSAFNAAEQARAEAKSATLALGNAVSAMRNSGSAFVRTVRAFAFTQDDPNVFVLANIPPPTPGSPLPVPDIPTETTGQLNNNGQIELEWKSSLKGRIFFHIERQVVPTGQPAGPWEIRGAMANKFYVDNEVPANASSVLYRVAAMRNNKLSLFSDPVQVMLSTPGAAVA